MRTIMETTWLELNDAELTPRAGWVAVDHSGIDRKHGKVEVRRKWWLFFSSASLFPARKQDVVTAVETKGDRPPYAKENPGRRYRHRLGG